jgi:hypothetical protein
MSTVEQTFERERAVVRIAANVKTRDTRGDTEVLKCVITQV